MSSSVQGAATAIAAPLRRHRQRVLKSKESRSGVAGTLLPARLPRRLTSAKARCRNKRIRTVDHRQTRPILAVESVESVEAAVEAAVGAMRVVRLMWVSLRV